MFILKDHSIHNNQLVNLQGSNITLSLLDLKSFSKQIELGALTHSQKLNYLSKLSGYHNYHAAVAAHSRVDNSDLVPLSNIFTPKNQDESNLDISLFFQDKVHNLVVTGSAGSGKRVVNSKIVSNYLILEGVKVRIIDQGGSYNTLMTLLQGEAIEVNEIKSINFLPEITQKNVAVVASFLIALAKVPYQPKEYQAKDFLGDELTDKEVETLKDELLLFVSKYKLSSNLTTLIQHLQRVFFNRHFVEGLQIYAWESNPYYKLFHGLREVHFESDAVLFDIKLEDPEVCQLVVLLLSTLVTMELSSNKKEKGLLFIDDFWLYTEYIEISKHLLSVVTMLNESNNALMLSTMSPVDFMNTYETQVLHSRFDQKVYLQDMTQGMKNKEFKNATSQEVFSKVVYLKPPGVAGKISFFLGKGNGLESGFFESTKEDDIFFMITQKALELVNFTMLSIGLSERATRLSLSSMKIEQVPVRRHSSTKMASCYVTPPTDTSCLPATIQDPVPKINTLPTIELPKTISKENVSSVISMLRTEINVLLSDKDEILLEKVLLLVSGKTEDTDHIPVETLYMFLERTPFNIVFLNELYARIDLKKEEYYKRS